MFCLPMGATLESWKPQQQPLNPVFSTFVLTSGLAAEKVYGAAVIFYEELSQQELGLLDASQRTALGLSGKQEASSEKSPVSHDTTQASNTTTAPSVSTPSASTPPCSPLKVYQSKSICLLSRCPFFDTYKKFLFYIYRIIFSAHDPLSHQIPIEK